MRPSDAERDRVEVVTLLWMTVEAVVGIGAEIVARSVLLTAFGMESVIELSWSQAQRCSGGL